MNTQCFLVHALSPLHAGTGHTPDVIDLPIARMKATGMPFVPGSSIKGVLRSARQPVDHQKTEAVFGPSDDPAQHAGAIIVGDARLLALPVRSFRGVFAWVTSPLLLTLARRDLGRTDLPIPSFDKEHNAWVARSSVCIHTHDQKQRIYLEDLDLSAAHHDAVDAWAAQLAPLVSPGEDIFTRRFVVVDDDTMAFLWETATQVDARVRLDPQTRTVAPGALWLEECLPPETLLLGLIAADKSRRGGVRMGADEVLAFALPKEEIHQLGGLATTGRGRCRVIPVLAQNR